MDDIVCDERVIAMDAVGCDEHGVMDALANGTEGSSGPETSNALGREGEANTAELGDGPAAPAGTDACRHRRTRGPARTPGARAAAVVKSGHRRSGQVAV